MSAPTLTPLQSGAAACVLDCLSDKETARALDKHLKHVQSIMRDLREKYAARNRVDLALKLERERVSA